MVIEAVVFTCGGADVDATADRDDCQQHPARMKGPSKQLHYTRYSCVDCCRCAKILKRDSVTLTSPLFCVFVFSVFFRVGFVFRLPLTRDLVYNWPFVCVVVVRGLRVAEDWQSKTLVTLSLSLCLYFGLLLVVFPYIFFCD